MTIDTIDLASSGRLTIDLAALEANYRILAARAAPGRAGAVVKANAYGLDARRVSRVLQRAGCEHFFVATLAEACALQPGLSPRAHLYVLNGLQPDAEMLCAKAGIIPVLNSLDQARRWAAMARRQGGPAPAALQVDSGMARLGLGAADLAELAADPDFFAHAPLALVLSHLACADEPDHPANQDQLARFHAMADSLPPAPRSLANSSGHFLGSGFIGDLTRPGVCLYGASAGEAAPPMRPVVALRASVLQVRDLPAGAGVGYGLTQVSDKPARIATIGVGYADGWPRALSHVGAVYFRGVRLPIVGRVSMDSFGVDVTGLGARGVDLAFGDEVELIGPHQTLEDVARLAGTIPYEILTRLGTRYHRTYLEELDMNKLAHTDRVDA